MQRATYMKMKISKEVKEKKGVEERTGSYSDMKVAIVGFGKLWLDQICRRDLSLGIGFVCSEGGLGLSVL